MLTCVFFDWFGDEAKRSLLSLLADAISATSSERRATTDRYGFPHRPFFYSLLKQLALKDSFYVHARRMHHVGIKFSGFDQVFDFGDGDLGRRRHHGIEIARGFAIDKVAPLVALPGLDEGEVGLAERAP